MNQETVQTVERALRILQAFSVEQPELRSSEIVRKVGLPRTIVVRILNTLQQAGFVEPVPGGSRHRLGLSACLLGAVYVATNPLTTVADEILKDVVDSTGCTVYLGTLTGDETATLRMYEGLRPVRFLWSPADRLPVTTSALGKAILMHMTQEQLTDIVGHDRLKILTERSLKTRAELDTDLACARARGWTSAEDESYPGLSAVGAAILDWEKAPVAAISAVFLNHPPDPARFEELGPVIYEAAQKLTRHVASRDNYGKSMFLQPPARHDSLFVHNSAQPEATQ